MDTKDQKETVVLGDYYNEMVDKLVTSGRYNNVDEIVRAAMSLLEEHRSKRAYDLWFWEQVDKGRDTIENSHTPEEVKASLAIHRAKVDKEMGFTE